MRHFLPLVLILSFLQSCGVVGFFRYGLPQVSRGDLRRGDEAPDAELVDLSGAPLRLRDSIGERPLVLVFGSFTWPPFRRSVDRIKDLHARYSEDADFLTIYIKEAHPEDEWQVSANENDDICYAQPTDVQGRLNIARDFRQRFDYEVPMLVDTMENSANDAYSAWPERLYVIDEEGKIAYKGRMGPMGFAPDEVEEWLEKRFGSR